ncbi:hypothetical protein IVB28_19905 [Bradyrhizobium sp. 199]|nr:hypothetical protein [Bradyrhizobium sp. 199]
MIRVAEHLGSDTFLYVDASPLGVLTRYAGGLSPHTAIASPLLPDPARIHHFDDAGDALSQPTRNGKERKDHHVP